MFIRLYFMKNGLETASKLLEEKEEIDKGYIMYVDINKDKIFEPITVGREPWVTDKPKNYVSRFYCLYHDDERTLQLTVGRSTVQIWHQINPDPNNKNDLPPNKG